MELNLDNIEIGALIEFEKGEDKGLWKVVGVEWLSDSEDVFLRITIDKDTGQIGDEKIIEYHLNNPRDIFVFTPFEEFHIDNAQSWPPPIVMIMGEDEIEYTSYNTDVEEEHQGYLAYVLPNGRTDAALTDDEIISFTERQHWEYHNEEDIKFFQIWLSDEMVNMYMGYSTNVNFIKVI